MVKPEVTTGCRVPKGWGQEIIIENNENYCGKVLVFNKDCKFITLITYSKGIQKSNLFLFITSSIHDSMQSFIIRLIINSLISEMI